MRRLEAHIDHPTLAVTSVWEVLVTALCNEHVRAHLDDVVDDVVGMCVRTLTM